LTYKVGVDPYKLSFLSFMPSFSLTCDQNHMLFEYFGSGLKFGTRKNI